jgi:membrane protease YdiL (CAAX protease family)
MTDPLDHATSGSPEESSVPDTSVSENSNESASPADWQDAPAVRITSQESQSQEIPTIPITSQESQQQDAPAVRITPQEVAEPLPGDPYVSATHNLHLPAPVRLPDDLQISWSWLHLLLFIFAGLASLLVVPAFLTVVIELYTHGTQQQMQKLFTNPGFLVGTQVLWFGAVFLFLYVTLGVLRHAPFWWTLGWRRLSAHVENVKAATYKPWMFLLSGSGLAIFVALASSRVKGAEKAPIEELFKDPHAALLLMSMAVLIAPLVEETVFRGYLYPLFASQLSRVSAQLGMDPVAAVRFGTVCGILITGFLFGMMHGSQLGWNWSLVSLLTLVGIIFTFARAATGTVLASFLMHLGYNSLIAITSIVATHGFQHAPPGP